MDNKAVIAILKNIIKELEKRLDELAKLRRKPGGNISDAADRQMEIFARISSLNIRVLHLKIRLNDRELAQNAAQAVPPLSPANTKAMNDALSDVSQTLSGLGTFKAIITLATEISDAASNAQKASA